MYTLASMLMVVFRHIMQGNYKWLYFQGRVPSILYQLNFQFFSSSQVAVQGSSILVHTQKTKDWQVSPFHIKL